MKRRISTIALAAIALLVALAGMLLISGAAAVVVTHGVSMQPVYTEGDLIVVARAPAYTEGDIAAYRQAEDDSVVLHRIVGGDAAAFTFQGDNNASIDPEAPDVSHIIGRAVIHIPQGGIWLERLSSPPVMAIMAFLLLTSGGAAATTRTRRKRRSQALSQHAVRPRPIRGIQNLPTRLKALTASAILLGIAAIALGAYAWAEPITEPSTALSAGGRMEFAYSAIVEQSPAYDGTSVSSPDAIFRNVVDTIELGYTYTGDPGALTLMAKLSTEGGWHSSVPLEAPAEVAGKGDQETVNLDLDDLERRAQEAAAVTGIPASSVNIAVTPAVQTRAGTTFQPTLNLTLTPLRLSLAGSPAELVVVDTQTTADVVASARTIGPDNWHLTVELARTVTAILLALGLFVLAGVALLARRLPAPHEDDEIRRRYGSLLVEVDPLVIPHSVAVAEVRRFASLAKVAEQFSLPVLTWREDSRQIFLVRDEGVSYRYLTGGTTTRKDVPNPSVESSVSAVSQP
jgi:signal peptidase I